MTAWIQFQEYIALLVLIWIPNSGYSQAPPDSVSVVHAGHRPPSHVQQRRTVTHRHRRTELQLAVALASHTQFPLWGSRSQSQAPTFRFPSLSEVNQNNHFKIIFLASTLWLLYLFWLWYLFNVGFIALFGWTLSVWWNINLVDKFFFFLFLSPIQIRS